MLKLHMFNLKPQRLIGDTAYGTAAMLAWMVQDKGIEPRGQAHGDLPVEVHPRHRIKRFGVPVSVVTGTDRSHPLASGAG